MGHKLFLTGARGAALLLLSATGVVAQVVQVIGKAGNI